ncbi:MAG: ribonuclease III domain-containing protein [Oscillatoria sp. PMC 1050.18]|nr:ribonuclease III domain-containing protein [Oscillatoria sp. PMC 1050.18]
MRPPKPESSNTQSSYSALTGIETLFKGIFADASLGFKPEQLSPSSLAYLGDAVYEIYIRTRYILPPKRISTYHRQVVAQVRAESQAAQLSFLEPHLSDWEREILRRGRNAATSRPKRVSGEIYQKATSLEALIGYLYLKDPQRLSELLAKLDLESEI